MSSKILIVDDDQTLLGFLKEYLDGEGFRVSIAESGSKAIKIFFQERPDLVVLDVMMPGMDGWEVCARIREMADTPIILLTAKSDESDKLRGFRLGIDDYVVKPFSLPELTARAKAVLARTIMREGSKTLLRVGLIEVDLKRHEVHKDGEPLNLTPTEFRLLAALCKKPGTAVSHEELVQEVWGASFDPRGGALRRFIWHLRQKIEADPLHPEHIQSVRGFGYRFEP